MSRVENNFNVNLNEHNRKIFILKIEILNERTLKSRKNENIRRLTH